MLDRHSQRQLRDLAASRNQIRQRAEQVAQGILRVQFRRSRRVQDTVLGGEQTGVSIGGGMAQRGDTLIDGGHEATAEFRPWRRARKATASASRSTRTVRSVGGLTVA